MDYPCLIVSSQKEESISIEMVGVLKHRYKMSIMCYNFLTYRFKHLRFVLFLFFFCFFWGGGRGKLIK